jgi:hypothetical protein
MPLIKLPLRIFCLCVLASVQLRAQITTMPVVTIQATDPLASWSGDSGTFTFFRDGPTNQTLNVFYLIGGSATNGVDYAKIGSLVTIPAGLRTNTVTISTINNGQTNIETVVLKLAASPLGIPQNYLFGYPASATVFITPADMTNLPPLVKIYTPTNGALLSSSQNVQLGAFGADLDGYVTSVEFFAGTQSLGVVSNGAIVDPPFPDGAGPDSRAFFLTWSNPAPGAYVLTAKATDNGGASSVSEPVDVTVVSEPPPTNIPPVVKISEPAGGATFYSPANIGICANAFDVDGFVATVQFFAGTQLLGIRTNNPMSAGPQNPFCLLWSNVPPGNYTLSAVATDNGGLSTTSGPVAILVAQGPPPTNYPPLVRITSPPNGAVFRAPLNLPLYAFAFERGGIIASVEFFDGTNNLGAGTGFCLGPVANPDWQTNTCPTNLFVLTWSNAAPGAYAISAVATDNGGNLATSSPVKITILSSPPPPTNRPPIVSVVASDPLAIEGTNCWPWLGLAGGSPSWSEWIGPSSVWRLFTNCGPKNASFTVHRWGDTNGDLTVSYEVGGTATNGIDYLPLSGSVVIPAGQRRADVTVVPLDDGPPDISSTVVLKLASSTNYVLGYPKKAAVLIIDSQVPRLGSGLLSDDSFHLGVPGPDGAWFHIDYSTDLLNWTSLCTNQVVNGSIDFIDPDASTNQSRFYRTVPESTTPTY